MPKTTSATSKATAKANQDPSEKGSTVASISKAVSTTKPAAAKATISQEPVISLLAPAKERMEESSEEEDDWEEVATALPEQSMPSDLDSAQDGAPPKFTISHLGQRPPRGRRSSSQTVLQGLFHRTMQESRSSLQVRR